jgi:formylglycine-generating enzyme required for sulfatase activity
VDVSWDDAAAYARWSGKRLPSEAEWERACRGLAEKIKYPWGDREPTEQDARYNVLDGPVPVCRFPKNGFALCDMAGNVWEWTADWYEKEDDPCAPGEPPGRKRTVSRAPRRLMGGSPSSSPALSQLGAPAERSPNIGPLREEFHSAGPPLNQLHFPDSCAF